MLNGLTMDFNALDLLASAAVLQTRDSDSSGGTECTTQGSGSGSSEGTEQGTDNDEDPNSSLLNTKTCTDLIETDTNMGSMKKEKHPEVTSVGDFPKKVISSDMDDLIEKGNEKTISQDVTVGIMKGDVNSISEKVDNSDTDSCVEEDIEEQVEVSTSTLDELSAVDVEDSPGKNKTIMRSLLTGQTVCDDVEDTTDNLQFDNCDDNNEPVSVLGNDSAIGLYVNEKIDTDLKMDDKEYSDLNADSKHLEDYPISDRDKDNSTSLHDSALESSQSASDQSSSLGDTESLHFLVVSDHCYATVPGKTSNLRCSYLGDEPESDSGIDGNSSSEEAEHRTRSISLESNCLQCSFPEVSGRSGQLLSQGSSDLERSPIGNSGFSLGLTVLSPTLSSSDSQCSDYHNNNSGTLDTVCDGNKKYKMVDFDVDNSLSSTTSEPAPEHNLKVGKFRIGKFASFTNIDTDQEKIYGRDAFSPEYGVSSSSTALPSSPGIPSLLQSPCGDWDRSDAGSEALDDLESFLTPEPPKELMMVLQGIKSPNSTALSPPSVQSSVVHHDHDYCFRSGALPPSPVTSKKHIKSEKRKYMTAARSRGTPASLKESKRSKTLKIKNTIKGPLSETIEKVKNSLATTPVPIDCNFKKPEQPVNSLLMDKLNPLNRQKRVKSLEIKEEIVEDGEVEIDAGSKLKITGKFQNDFVYFLNKTSRNRRRSSVETSSLPLESKKTLQPAKPIDIIIPHLTDEDLEVLQTKGRAGLARLEKFSSNPNLLDRFSATLQTSNNKAGTPTVTSGDRIKNNNGVDDDDKIINTILSMENDNLGSPVPVDDVNHEMDFFGDGETINLMGENMTLTKDQVDLLLNAVKHVATPEVFTDNEKVDLVSTDCDHSSTCSTEILDPNTSDVANPEWTINNNTPKIEKQDTDTESTYSSSDVGPSSCVSDIKEDSQESFEMRSDIVIQEDQADVLTTDSDVAMQKVVKDQKVNIKIELDNVAIKTETLDVKSEIKDDIVIPNIGVVIKTEMEIKVEKDVIGLVKSDVVEHGVNVDSNLVDKSLNRSITNVTDNKIMTVDEIVKPMIIDNELGHIDITDTKPDKSLLDTALNAFPNSLGPSLTDLSLPLEKSFELLGGEFRLDKPDELFPEANVESTMPGPTESDYNDTPWVVTVTVFWNDLPAIMINNRPYIRLVDIHKQILPAKDTGILKKRCQLLSIHVVNCTEMQRYFLVQYGRGYNSKSTLIVGKADACQLVGYYAQPQPRLPRSEDGVLNNMSRLSQHMAMIRGKQSRFNKRKRPGSKTASRNTSPDRKDGTGIKNGVVPATVPTSPKPRKQPPPPPVIQPELTKRLRHKKINFLEMLKGDSQDKVEVEDQSEKKVTPHPVAQKKKLETVKKTNNRTPPNNKKKEIEIVVTPGCASSEEEEESEDLSETDTEEEFEELSEDVESESEEAEDSEASEEVITSKKKVVKTNGNNIKQSPKKSPKSPIDKSPNGKRKLGPLRVNVQGLLNFPKSVKKSAINEKTGCKNLDVVHTPLEFHDGMIPISQSGKVFLDLYKKKSSLCVKCADCDKLLSISSFLQHQHYPEESKTLTTVLNTQTLSLKSSEMSRNIKQLWEELQKRYEKFEGCRFLKPVVKALISARNSEKLSNFKPVIVRENYPQPVPVVRDNIPVPNMNISLECETDIVHVNENLPQTILDNSEITQVESVENNSETPLLNHCHIDNCHVDKTSEESSANNKELNTVKCDETVMEGLDSNPPMVKIPETTIIQPCKKSVTVKSSRTEVTTTASKNNNIQTMDSGLDKSGVRSSSRKRKSRQYFSFEDYSFSNKKTKMEDSDCK